MKIGLLNLLFDNNYGGNLQRYALSTVLAEMGHDVTYLYCCRPVIGIRNRMVILIRSVITDLTTLINNDYLRRHLCTKYGNPNRGAEIFLNRYIKHTPIICYSNDLRKYCDFDAYVVGSDQVWRKEYTKWCGIDAYFFSFIPEDKLKLAYAVSFGGENNVFSQEDAVKLKPLYEQFKAVSVREKNGLDIINSMGWHVPMPELVLDPTFLLSKTDYEKLISNDKKYQKIKGDVLVYCLDKEEEINEFLSIHTYLGEPYRMGIQGNDPVSIPQWLRCFSEAKYVITDSYHGLLFSIIFNKPFYLFVNENRGASRFYSILQLLSLNANSIDITEAEWSCVNQKILELKEKSLSFLAKAFN